MKAVFAVLRLGDALHVLVSYLPFFLPAVFATAGATILFLGTPWGIGLSPDSVVYIASARSLLNGQGLTVPSYSGAAFALTHYPPLYPSLLAGLGVFGVDPVLGARWLGVVLFAANIGLVGLIVHAHTGSMWASALGALVMMISPSVVQIHTMAWSEALFIFFELLSVLFFSFYVTRPRRGMLAAAAAAVALAFLSRYAGLALVVAGFLTILWIAGQESKKRLGDAALFAVLSSFPIALWLGRNLLASGGMLNRPLSFHPITVEQLMVGGRTVGAWVLPDQVRSELLSLIGVIVVTGGLVWVCVKVIRRPCSPEVSLPRFLNLFAVSYVILLLVFVSLIDAQTPLDSRILAPVYVLLLLLGVSLVTRRIVGNGHGWREAIAILVMVFGVIQGTEALAWLRHGYDHGIGYASPRFKNSDIVKKLSVLDFTIPVFSNAPDLIYMVTGRLSNFLPRAVDPVTRRSNPNFLRELRTMEDLLRRQEGLVVYFSMVSWRWYLPSEDELMKALALEIMLREPSGTIYRLASH